MILSYVSVTLQPDFATADFAPADLASRVPVGRSNRNRAHPPGTCMEHRAEAVCRTCAAAFLGVGPSTFDDHIRPDLDFVRVGTKLLYPLTTLRKWIADHTQEVQCRENRKRGASTDVPIPATGRSSGAAAMRPERPSTHRPSPLVQKLREKLRAAG